MWESNNYNNTDGLTPLLEMFSNEDEFIAHFIDCARFFKQEHVAAQSSLLYERIEKGEKIPVRFSMKVKENFHYENDQTIKGTSKRSFKNKKEAKEFAEQNDYYHNDTKVKVIIDKDGNYFVREEICKYAGFRVSQGAISDVTNSMISHIWANTDNPLFFTSLWNIAITPHYLSFILDKPDANSTIVRRLKAIMKAICFIVYEPDKKIGKKYFDITDFEGEMQFAQDLINKGKIHYINWNSDGSPQTDFSEIVEGLYNENDEIKGNKDFAYALLEGLAKSGMSFVDKFLDKAMTTSICKMSYPILVDVSGDTKKAIEKKLYPVNSQVYYSSPLFEHNGYKYLVCNDWKMHHKEMIIQWLEGNTN